MSTKTRKSVPCQQKKVNVAQKGISCRQKQNNAAKKKYFVLNKVINFYGTARHRLGQHRPCL